ncbi:MAG: hypothetical protein WAV31_05390 [Candidatus Moraniibacteriota bacterium]
MNKEYKPFGLGLSPDQLPKTPEDAEKLWNALKPLIEEMKEPDGEKKMSNEVAKAKGLGFVPGAKAKLSHDAEVGEVVGYNEAVGGFYPGSRYPVIIKFDRGTFEYSLEQLELVGEKK